MEEVQASFLVDIIRDQLQRVTTDRPEIILQSEKSESALRQTAWRYDHFVESRIETVSFVLALGNPVYDPNALQAVMESLDLPEPSCDGQAHLDHRKDLRVSSKAYDEVVGRYESQSSYKVTFLDDTMPSVRNLLKEEVREVARDLTRRIAVTLYPDLQSSKLHHDFHGLVPARYVAHKKELLQKTLEGTS